LLAKTKVETSGGQGGRDQMDRMERYYLVLEKDDFWNDRSVQTGGNSSELP